MAVACTAMEVRDRRLSISKASASKISKPSSVLKNHSASSSSSAASSPSSLSSSPPTQLPSSITSSPSRPIAKVVNADPSSFRRIVQELTGTTLPSAPSPSSSQPLRGLSRLHRIAPPPLRPTPRTLQDPQHHQTLLQQMQHHQTSQTLLLQQHLPKVGPISPTLPVTEFGNPNPNLTSDPMAQLGNPNPNPNFTPSLPMLSPHLLSPLPALTPRDNTWANQIDVISESPKPVMSISTSISLPSMGQLPNFSYGNYPNGHGNALVAKPAHTSDAYVDAMWSKPTPPMSSTILSSNGQVLPPLLSTPSPPPWPMQQTSSINVLPPWSPSPMAFSPLFSPPPGPVAPPIAAAPHVINGNPSSHIQYYSSMNPNVSKNFTF